MQDSFHQQYDSSSSADDRDVFVQGYFLAQLEFVARRVQKYYVAGQISRAVDPKNTMKSKVTAVINGDITYFYHSLSFIIIHNHSLSPIDGLYKWVSGVIIFIKSLESCGLYRSTSRVRVRGRGRSLSEAALRRYYRLNPRSPTSISKYREAYWMWKNGKRSFFLWGDPRKHDHGVHFFVFDLLRICLFADQHLQVCVCSGHWPHASPGLLLHPLLESEDDAEVCTLVSERGVSGDPERCHSW